MKKNIGEVIAANRKRMKKSQIDLAKDLERYDIHVKNAAISSWEKNNNTPTAAQLLALCQILEITDVYEEFIGENPKNPFSGLNDDGVKKALDYIELLKASGMYKKEIAPIIPIGRRIKVAMLPASAGTGNIIDDEMFEEVEVFDTVPVKADFGVYLSGDSMEPHFQDQELVWIERTEVLTPGEIGLFYLNGMTYFKKYISNASGTFLQSLNVKYAPIPVKEFDSFKIFGKLALD